MRCENLGLEAQVKSEALRLCSALLFGTVPGCGMSLCVLRGCLVSCGLLSAFGHLAGMCRPPGCGQLAGRERAEAEGAVPSYVYDYDRSSLRLYAARSLPSKLEMECVFLFVMPVVRSRNRASQRSESEPARAELRLNPTKTKERNRHVGRFPCRRGFLPFALG